MIKRCLLLSSFAFSAGSALLGANLPDYVEDRTALFAYVPDFPKLRTNYNLSPFAKTLADDGVKRYFGPLLAKMDLEKWDAEQKAKTGMSLEELWALAEGELLITVQMDPATGKGSPILILEVSDEKKAEKLALLIQEEAAKKKAEEQEKAAAEEPEEGAENAGEDGPPAPAVEYAHETATVSGAELHSTFSVTEGEEGTTRNETGCWTVTEGKFVFGMDQTSVGRTVVALKGSEPDSPLSRSEGFLRARDRLKGEGLVLGVDFNVLVPSLLEGWKAEMAKQPPNPMLNPDGIFAALGLTQLDALTMALSLGDKSMDSYVGFTYHANQGLVKLLAFTDGPLPKPNFVPERWLSVTSTRFSLPGMYAAIEEILQAYNPAWYGMANAMVTGGLEKYGVQLQRDVLVPMGDEFIAAQALRQGKTAATATAYDMDNFYAVSLKDPKVMTGSLAALTNALDPQKQGIVTTREFMGNTLYTMAAGMNPQQEPNMIAFAVVGNHLMFSTGSAGAIEAAIRTSKGEEKSWWDRKDVKQAMEALPSEANSFSFQNNEVLIAMIFATLESASAAAEKAEGGEPFVDASAKPDIETIARFWGPSYGHSWRDAHGIHGVSTLPYTE